MKPLQKPTIDPRIRRFRSALRVFESLLDLTSRREEYCCGVTLAQCHALLALSEDKTVSLKDLTGKLNLDKSTLSRTVDSLVEGGLADRKTGSGDRRICCISLTTRGRAAVDRINGTWDRFAAGILERVPESKREAALEGLEILAKAFLETVGAVQHSSSCCREREK
ncbi:MAG: MarR family winged helix-turn-helix transcriptional regulator [bacterium]|nr:MarR family winged helix-turn-helix transcriptional regulator [bacterium]